MNKWDPNERHKCHDCGCLEGELHHPGCDMERCPFCLGQLISCGCETKYFYSEYQFGFVPFCGLPEKVYQEGLSKEQQEFYEQVLKLKGLIPYILTPNLCERCGQTWPEMFLAEDWKEVIPKDIQGKMLCGGCYEVIKSFVLEGKKNERLS